MLWSPALSPAQSTCWCQRPKANPTCITPLPARKGNTLVHFDDRGNLVIVKAAPVSQEGSHLSWKKREFMGFLSCSGWQGLLLVPNSSWALTVCSSHSSDPEIKMYLLIYCSGCDSDVCLHLWEELLNSFLKKCRRETVYNMPTFTQRKRIECTAPSSSCKTPGYCQFVSKWEIPWVPCPKEIRCWLPA